jgi:Zn finger protein HypA/HybF involved in hydrogenase expression
VDFYFDLLSKVTIGAWASLFFMRILASLRCRNCNTVLTSERMNFQCPDCREEQVEIVAGRELYIDSMEVA